MADYHTPEARASWRDALDTAERENKNDALIAFAARSYRRECTHAADEELARLKAGLPSIPDVWRTYDAWQEAERRMLGAASCREDIDAEIDATRLYRIANITRAKWEENHGSLLAGESRRSPTLRRLKRAPTTYVRGPNGIKFPRSKSHVPC